MTNANYAQGAGQQAILRLLSDGEPRTARQVSETLGLAKRTVWGALQVMRGQAYRHLALVTVHAGPPDVPVRLWTITGAGRLSIRKEAG